MRVIKLPCIRKQHAYVRRLKRLFKYLCTRTPNVPFELCMDDLELVRKAVSRYIAEELAEEVEYR
jgi:hypothetical protein